jgi:hypothetical protein
MLSRVDFDDLLFAPERARWLEEPGKVAADLLDAAGHSDRFDGVTAQEVTVRAARLLWDFGERKAGLAILRRVIADNTPDADGLARYELAMVLAQAGDPDEAQAALLDSVSCEEPGSMADVRCRARLAVDFVYGGHLDLAAEWADSAVDAAEAGKGPQRQAAIRAANQSRADVLEKIRVARADGPDAAHLVDLRLPGLVGPLDRQPWPALSGGSMVWWPEREYDRLVRQVGEVTNFLGTRWSDHAAIVESAMRTAAAVSTEPISLVEASFVGFTMFVAMRKADPREASTMTAFTTFMGTENKPVRWPPPPRKPCWCQSGRRYKDCCERRGGPGPI